jgi:hypothetical protein
MTYPVGKAKALLQRRVRQEEDRVGAVGNDVVGENRGCGVGRMTGGREWSVWRDACFVSSKSY